MDDVAEHLPLVDSVVVQVASRFPRHVDRTDLAHAGALGLVEAATRWDPEKGPFASFAARRIRGAVLDAVRAADWAPRSVRRSAREIDSVNDELTHELGRPPTDDELADAVGRTTAELSAVRDRVHRSVVLTIDYPMRTNDGEIDLRETIPDDVSGDPGDALERRELIGQLRAAINDLPERHRLIVVGYFIEGRTSGELARFMGVTESRVSQLRTEAVAMLRRRMVRLTA